MCLTVTTIQTGVASIILNSAAVGITSLRRKPAPSRSARGDKMLESAETPKFSGLVIASLYSDPQLISKSGSVVIAAEAALGYGFKDFNGKQRPSLREQKGSPRPFFTKG